MDLNQMRYFLAVAESQHMTRSAEQLHISQPSLTKSIHKLEDELGMPLFTAKGRNIILTEYGKYLRDRLAPIIEEIDELPEQLRRMANMENETIHVNVLSASSIVSEAVIEYKRKHANVNFKLIQNDREELYDVRISTGKKDMQKGIDEEHAVVFTEEIYLAVPRVHPLADLDSVALKDMKDEDYIALVGPNKLRDLTNQMCQQAGFSPRIVFESDTPQVVRNMIAANLGVGFWPGLTWRSVKSRNLKLLPISDYPYKREVMIDWRENKSDCQGVREFYEFLVAYFNERE